MNGGSDVVRQAVLVKNRVVLAVLRFRSHGKGRGLLHVTCGKSHKKAGFSVVLEDNPS
jgi:hypothetical protein